MFFNWSEVKTADGAAFGLRGHLVSPDGRKIAGWTGAGFTNGTLWVVPTGRRSLHENCFALTGNPNPTSGRALAWTADGRAVLINRPEGQGAEHPKKAVARPD